VRRGGALLIFGVISNIDATSASLIVVYDRTILDPLRHATLASYVPVSLDQYGRTVAMCSGGGVDLSDWLVLNDTH
jgi:hypothetical protein